MLSALLVLTLLLGLAGLVLSWLGRRLAPNEDDLVERINAVLPQTQCAQCGYPGCRPYARAIAEGEAAINQCPPGGQEGVRALAELLNVEPVSLDASRGEPKPAQIARIDEDRCIGCTLCIQACPVDAIFGSARHMHTVIEAECTGCELCLPPCPVDCIDLIEIDQPYIPTRPEREGSRIPLKLA